MAKEPKGLEKRIFSTVPTKALFNAKLTALEWRVLGLIALHDGMTLVKQAQGKPLGAGCTASNLTLAREAQCSYAALVRAVKSLEDYQLIERHDRRGGRTEAAMRVRYEVPDNIPDGSQQYDEPVILNVTDPSYQYDENDHSSASRPAENRGGQPPHYNSLRGELDSAEAEELNSPKGRDFQIARPTGIKFHRQLPANLFKLPAPAAIAIIERAFASVDRQVDEIPVELQRTLTRWLFEKVDELGDEPSGQQAMRLCEEISAW